MSGLADIPGLAPLSGEGTSTQDQSPAPSNAIPPSQDAEMEDEKPADVSMVNDEAPPSPPSLTSGLEAMLGGLDPPPPQEPVLAPTQPSTTQQDDQPQEQGDPEWEEDSSPYESSSDSSSSDDSDEELLGPEETARILMEMDGGSDDDGDGKAKGSGSAAQVRTKNELPEEVVPKPDVVITSDMELIELGSIEHIVESTVVVKANTTGEYRVLDSGSVISKEDRTVIAAVADLIGNVLQPRYTARFTNDDEIKAYGLELGTKVFYTPKHASYVFTQTLRQQKGTDASNWHDEEPADDEMEFSDDEKEAEYKRQQKAKKKGARGGRGGAAGRGGHEAPSAAAPDVSGLQYDDDDDGPYKKLARPASLAQGTSAPPESSYTNNYRGNAHRGGRGRGQRGHHGRGGHDNRGNRGGARSGHSLPPRPPRGQEYQQAQPQQFNYPPAPAQTAPNMPYAAAPQFYGAGNGQQGYQAHQQPNPQFPFAWPQNMPPGFVPPPPPQFTGQPAGNNVPYYNPDFIQAISQMQNQLQPQQNPQGQRNGEWPGFGGAG
ncbi:NAF1-domain-containing protein [Hypoxylon rubiginosum]|uniref:NAF1-domain-containing protein n=1 Tax=Hypoxylon rubiginosum TaxID=110542 RepID=A0ACC0CTM5_9PEZI|nr:NAF1-domain-containing protein [Hypoxylon rubiginosum]